MKKRVFITRSILSDGPDLLRSNGIEVVEFAHDRPMSYEELLKEASGFDGLITTLSDRIDENFLNKNSQLKVISNYAVGFNNIDVQTASALKIAIGNTPDVLTEATAELALGLMISAARQFHAANSSVAQGEWKDWEPKGFLGHSLSHKTLGIIGLGRIGSRLAEMAASAFKMKIIYTSQTEKNTTFPSTKVSLESLLAQSDFISLHTPLTDKTTKMIGKKEFSVMKKSAVLINTARGSIIDQDALIDALKNNQIFGAGLDVTDVEPLPKDCPLNSLKNVMILPHIGSATFEARRAMSILCAENIILGLSGKELKAMVNKKDLLP